MPNDRFPCSIRLGRALVDADIAILTERSSPDPHHARRSLRLARLLELHDDEPSPAVAWLLRYLDDCTAAGSR